VNNHGLSDLFIKGNHLKHDLFSRWIFHPGMLFGSQYKWWGDYGKRSRPHEGLDLCYFLDQRGQLQVINKDMNIPAFCGGTVVNILDDFLGKSVFLKTATSGGVILYFAYGHLNLVRTLKRGMEINPGTILGKLSETGTASSAPLPHLHLTMAYPRSDKEINEVTWDLIADDELFQLLDPLLILTDDYSIIFPDGID
jgi:hypothetical protein